MVNHGLLIHSLANAGITSEWLSFFLHSVYGGGLSQQHPLDCGILQGAILSLTLFYIYMCPLTQIIQRHRLDCHQYADETQLHLLLDSQPGFSPEDLNGGIQAIIGWLKQS